MKDIFYTVYKITNLINQKIYIGVHKTVDINDDYMGSGIYLNRAKEKYGIENFSKEILEVFDNVEDMFDMESTLVNEDFVNDTNTYNLKVGGFGGWDYINENNLKNTTNWQVTGTNSFVIKYLNDPVFKEQIDEHLSIISKIGQEKLREKYINGWTFSGKSHTEETKKKMSESAKGKHDGSKNSQFGTMWIHNLEEKQNKKIKKEDFPMYEEGGWLKGRKMKF
jgi:hypothetical protein